MKRHFYFFRHGQTNENQAGQRYGTGIEAYLTESGIKQAEKLAEYFADKNVGVIYSSPYKRSVDTAKIAIKNCSDIITNDALKEIVFGFWYDENDPEYKNISDNFNRIKDCLESIVISNNQNVAISSHGGVTRALCWACGYKVDGIKNCQCFHFTLEDGTWEYIETFDPDIK